MENRILLGLVFFVNLFRNDIYACVNDITHKDMASVRQQLFENVINPGLRLSYTGIKEANANDGLGGVNKAMEDFEQAICDTFEKSKKNSPDFKYDVKKTDFKGYYITCSPMPSCMNAVEPNLSAFQTDFFGKKSALAIQLAKANNYPEGYIKSRVMANYDNVSGPVDKFIKDEIVSSLKDIDTKRPGFIEELSTAIDMFRKNGDEGIDPKMARLIKSLDMLEIPFANSNNVEAELASAMEYNGSPNAGKYSVKSAISGDDLFIVIKDNEKIVKIIGGDARGLGNANILARYSMFSNYLNNGHSINSLEDIIQISKSSIKNADSIMDDSLSGYYKMIVEEVSKVGSNLDEAIAKGHKRYIDLEMKNPNLMQVRSGAIENCGDDKKIILNRITKIHNDLKKLEAIGIDGFYGMSCLATKYWMIKNGL